MRIRGPKLTGGSLLRSLTRIGNKLRLKRLSCSRRRSRFRGDRGFLIQRLTVLPAHRREEW
jgi:hypothetical protein